MAYDEGLAQRIRDTLVDQDGLVEKKMFGGVAFMVHGNMACGVVKEDLMVRVGPDAYDEALDQPNARPMDFTGKPMRGMIYVDGGGLEEEEDLEKWVQRGTDFALSLPAK
ncbi:MAG: RNA methyltransferase [Chloroflexi bacterium]|nr:MAG: RNA methyltransferase [Chloroflexota bacterium]MBL1196402.1 RNA methyltransferase [Chloroflexota bacterium]NOH13697.1 RNA methyltransferase [Chloroflexota bacterium]